MYASSSSMYIITNNSISFIKQSMVGMYLFGRSVLKHILLINLVIHNRYKNPGRFSFFDLSMLKRLNTHCIYEIKLQLKEIFQFMTIIGFIEFIRPCTTYYV
uniref:Maturase K n=1 Tax=Cacopsylla melanoneura TaxID=428564 RepID=A0A8D8TFY7_9HEMI